ncbi:MAG: hypothetical protein WAN13_16455 [Candidatus Acidiferrales bacterium]
MNRRPRLLFFFIAAILMEACSGPATSNQTAVAPAQPAAPAIPADIQQVAETSLGSEAEVLVYGDLALTGKQQILVINRIKKTPDTKVPGTLVTRLAIVEDDGGTWKQVLLCDEHLKNPSGYLAATPIAPVSGWRLQYEHHPDSGLVLYFTPLDKPAGGYVQTIGVKWNPKVKRYQSLDRTYEQFLGETNSLEIPEMRVK